MFDCSDSSDAIHVFGKYFASYDVHCEFCNVRGLERRIKDRSMCCSGWQTFHPEEERLQKHREDAGIS